MKTNPGLSGFNKCIGINRTIMNVVGVWPSNDEKDNGLTKYYVTISILILFYPILPQARKAYLIHNDLNELIEILSTLLITLIISIMKLLGLWYNKLDLKTIINNIFEDWNSATMHEQKIMWKFGNFSRLIATLSITANLSICFLLCVRSYVDFLIQNHDLPSNATILRPLYLKSDFLFDIQNSPTYEIIYITQFITAVVCAFAHSSFDGFFLLVVMHYSGQLHNLHSCVENLIENQILKKCSFMEVFVPVINRHRHVCKNIDIIEKSFNNVFLGQIFLLMIVMCLQGYQFVTTNLNNGVGTLPNLVFMIIYIIASIVSLLMLCYTAEQLRIQSEKLFLSIFKMKWYELPPQESRLLLMMMRRTEKPISITVGKFADLSLEYFSSVLKTSGGYVSVLLAMKDKL